MQTPYNKENLKKPFGAILNNAFRKFDGYTMFIGNIEDTLLLKNKLKIKEMSKSQIALKIRANYKHVQSEAKMKMLRKKTLITMVKHYLFTKKYWIDCMSASDHGAYKSTQEPYTYSWFSAI